MIVGIGNDHGGLNLKNEIIKYLEKNKIEYINFGTNSENSTDYPIYAKKVTSALLKNEIDRGILICSTGIGISIAANKIKGIRAALCNDIYSARLTREHNNANILALGEKVIGVNIALEVVETFLKTEFSNKERHINRIKLIEN